ncbi:MAG TPA: hypothetical protein VNW29_02770 [Candidatus Sulfotelmatobacter sp.]|jgi:hypothetical protein|nr:hypothetical protein [Candidatus Sulfotelmatobacter sp.]
MSLQASIAFLQNQQQKDGSFLSLSSPDPTQFIPAITFHSVFSTALILSCLTNLQKSENEHIKNITLRAATFLLAQKSTNWTFNYWARNSQETKQMPYPDDLDDTFCALTALYQYDPTLITGTILAKIVSLLTTFEKKEGGPYQTWVVPKNATSIWTDVDLAVNINIAFFLHLHKITLPNLTTFFEKNIIAQTLCSPYYPTVYPILYFLSRFYRGPYVTTVTNLLFAKQVQGAWGNPLDTALCLIALRNWEVNPQKLLSAVAFLQKLQQQNGSWQAVPFYTGVNPKRNKPFYAGSLALTTAFCIEALFPYTQDKKQFFLNRQQEIKTSKMHKKILSKAIHFTKSHDSQIASQFSHMIERVTKTDVLRQITLLPFFFAQSIAKKHQQKISNTFLIQLGYANLLGWIAYTIYDDFLDDHGDKKTLAVANICLRELTVLFISLFPQGSLFDKHYKKIMDGIESANLWELTNARFIPEKKMSLTTLQLPDWEHNQEIIANRSLGHALGPLAIMYHLKQNEIQIASFLTFFRHYLIAKQLNDDAHDYEEDFTKGMLTPVVTRLVHLYLQKQKTSPQPLSLKKLTKKLKILFWYELLDAVVTDIFFHIQQARNSLAVLSLITDKLLLEKLLTQLETAAKEALLQRDRTIEFIKAYD